MIAWPNSAKKQPMTSAAVNTKKLSQAPKIHPRASQAFLPFVHGPAKNITTSGSDQKKQSPTPDDNLKDTVASLERDYPLTPPSPSRIIKISTTSNDDEDDENVENRAYEKREYDLATWRMYNRIMESRRHQENLPTLSPLVVAQMKEEAAVTYLKPFCPPLSTCNDASGNVYEISSRDERAQSTTRHLVRILDRAHRIADSGGSTGGTYHPSTIS